jgi:hypothetical protein
MELTPATTPADEQRKALALAFLQAFEDGGTTSSGGSVLDLFADDARVCFPKWGAAHGRAEIADVLVDVGPTIHSISHDLADINWVGTGGDVLVAEGTSHGVHRDGSWGRARRSGAADAGATCSRSMTATSTASSSTWTRNTRARTPPVTRGSSRGATEQAAFGHAAEVVGHAAAFPVHRLDRLLEVLPPMGRTGEGHEDDVVGDGPGSPWPAACVPACWEVSDVRRRRRAKRAVRTG